MGASHADVRQAFEGWRWVRFGSESGLPSERVERVCETRNGEIWVQTSRGLAWFDGFRWNPRPVPGLEHGDDIVDDAKGILVFQAGVVFHVDADTAYRVSLVHRGDSLLARYAWPTAGGHIFQGDSMLFQESHGKITHMPSPYDGPAPRVEERKYLQDHLLPTRRFLLLKAGQEIFRFEENRWRSIFRSPTGYLRVRGCDENEAGYGVAVIETEKPRQDIYFWEPGGRPRRFPGQEGDLILSLDVSPDGETLMLLNSGGLRLHRKGKFEDLPSFPSPVNNPVRIHFRANGDLWVCSARGLFLCHLSSDRWSTWATGAKGRQSMVNCFTHVRDGSFWIGTADGLCVRSPEGKTTFIREINGEPLASVTAIAEDNEGNIWIGDGGIFRGVYRWDGKTWRKFGRAEGLVHQGREPFIHKIVRTRSGQLWFCGMASNSDSTEKEPGAFRFADGQFRRLREGLLDGRVFAVVEDRWGALWFGTKTGLSRLHQGGWTYWRCGKELKSDHRVFALAVDSSNNLWMGRQWNGLTRIDTAGNVRVFSAEYDGLVSDDIWDILVDANGWIWVGTRGGVGCYDGTQWLSFDVHTGLLNGNIWPILVEDQCVYAGTMGDGIAVLHLDQLKTVKPPRIGFANPLIEDDGATLSWDANAYWADVPANQIETRYRLEGGTWSKWSTARTVVFNGLDDGMYRFEVEPRPTSWQGEPMVHSVTFAIPPPLYLRPVVALPMLVLGLLVLTLAGAVWDRKRRYDQAVRESEARFRALYKSNSMPTFTWKRTDGRIVFINYNDAAVSIWGTGIAGAVGREIGDVMRDLPRPAAMIQECFVSQWVVRGEISYTGGLESRTMQLAITCSFVFPDMVLTHVEDITERRQAEVRIRESREQLRALASRLETVREEERSQLSREIHDELGQLMTGLKMDLAWIRKRVVECGEQVAANMMERIQQMNALLDESIQTVRKIAGQLRPALLDELGLTAAMEWQAKEWQARTGITCQADILTDDPGIPKEQAIEIFRIFQELLTNVARHAGATRVTVVLSRADHEVLLEVNDNGCGIRMDEIDRPMSLGILGMEERAARIGGTIQFSGESGRGTTVRVTIPIQQAEP